MMQKYGRCGCFHHHLVPLFMVLIALVILLGNFGVITPGWVEMIWPVLLGLAGIQLMLQRRCRCCGTTNCDCKCGCGSCGTPANEEKKAAY